MRLLLSSVVTVMLAMGFSSTFAAQQPRDVPPQSVNTVDDRRDGRDWGWLGLAGLVGLMGMKRRESHDRPVVRTDHHPSTAR